LMAALAAARLRAGPAPSFRPNRAAERGALAQLNRDLAVQHLELVEFYQEEGFWITTVIDHRERPPRRWQYVISRKQAPTRAAAFAAIRRRFIAVAADGIEPD